MKTLFSIRMLGVLVTALCLTFAVVFASFGGNTSLGLVLAAPADAPSNQYGVGVDDDDGDTPDPNFPECSIFEGLIPITGFARLLNGDLVLTLGTTNSMVVDLDLLPQQGSSTIRQTALDQGLILAANEVPIAMGALGSNTILLFRLPGGSIQINVYNATNTLVDDTVEVRFPFNNTTPCLFDRGVF